MCIHSREKECNLNNPDSYNYYLNYKKIFLYIILIIHPNLNVGYIISLGYPALKLVLHSFCLGRNSDWSVSLIGYFDIL